jgi:hypothetical protein
MSYNGHCKDYVIQWFCSKHLLKHWIKLIFLHNIIANNGWLVIQYGLKLHFRQFQVLKFSLCYVLAPKHQDRQKLTLQHPSWSRSLGVFFSETVRNLLARKPDRLRYNRSYRKASWCHFYLCWRRIAGNIVYMSMWNFRRKNWWDIENFALMHKISQCVILRQELTENNFTWGPFCLYSLDKIQLLRIMPSCISQL